MISSLRLPRFPMRCLSLTLMLPASLFVAVTTPWQIANSQTTTISQNPATSQPAKDSRALMIDSDTQEANSETGVFTARGNVRINYPARQVQATAAQAQYFSKERKIVLSGDVYVLQQGNSIKGESVTYLIDEGRFIANPKQNAQVESIYIIAEPNPNAPTQQSTAPQTPTFNPKPAPATPSIAPPATPRR